MERKVGEVFNFQSKKLRVEKREKHTCCDCFFDGYCNKLIVNPVAGNCVCREDGYNVIFVEVSER